LHGLRHRTLKIRKWLWFSLRSWGRKLKCAQKRFRQGKASRPGGWRNSALKPCSTH
jgi:hypothetical protein